MKCHHLEPFWGKQKEAMRFMMFEGLFGVFQQGGLKGTGGLQAGMSLLQKPSYAGFHLTHGLVCEGEGQDFMGMVDTTQELYESGHKEHGLAGTSRGLHMMALSNIYGKFSCLVIRGQLHIIRKAI